MCLRIVISAGQAPGELIETPFQGAATGYGWNAENSMLAMEQGTGKKSVRIYVRVPTAFTTAAFLKGN